MPCSSTTACWRRWRALRRDERQECLRRICRLQTIFVRNDEVTIVTVEGREQRRDLRYAQWAWERKLDADNFSKACGE
jgi:hypothetical protein